MLETLVQFMHLSGDAAMVFAAVGLWRLDRRVVRIETHLFGPGGVRE